MLGYRPAYDVEDMPGITPVTGAAADGDRGRAQWHKNVLTGAPCTTSDENALWTSGDRGADSEGSSGSGAIKYKEKHKLGSECQEWVGRLPKERVPEWLPTIYTHDGDT